MVTVVQASSASTTNRRPDRSYANADVEFTGVASTGFDVDGKVTSFELFVTERQRHFSQKRAFGFSEFARTHST